MNYAGGEGGVAYAMTKLAKATNTGFPFFKSYGANMFPKADRNKEKKESHDQGVYGGEAVEVGRILTDGNREEYLQDVWYLDLLIAQVAAGLGGIAKSYAIHWQDHITLGADNAGNGHRYESFGCYVKELTLNIPQNDGTLKNCPSWSIKDGCYDTKYSTGAAAGETVTSIDKTFHLAIASSPIQTKAKVTVGGVDINGLDASLTFSPRFTEDWEHGDDSNKYPLFLGMDISLKITGRNTTQNRVLLTQLKTALASETLYAVKVDLGDTMAAADRYINITNMRVVEGDDAKVSGLGIRSNEITLESTNTTVLISDSA
jgi:hypothetical protein